jgi:hypothetical protein
MTVEEAVAITEKYIADVNSGLKPVTTMEVLEATFIRCMSEIASEKIIFRGTEERKE